jgi:hypothetical protein
MMILVLVHSPPATVRKRPSAVTTGFSVRPRRWRSSCIENAELQVRPEKIILTG